MSLLSPIERWTGPSFEQTWIPFHPRMLLSTSWEEDKMWKVYRVQTNRQAMDNRSAKKKNERKSEQAHIPHAPTLLENAVYNEWQFQALGTGNGTKKGI